MWNGACVGNAFAVPTAYCAINLKVKDGYSFANSGKVVVYMDGRPIGAPVTNGTLPFNEVQITYSPPDLNTTCNALDELVVMEQGQSGIEKQLDSDVFDGTMLTFEASFDDGPAISASGANAFPDGRGEFGQAIDALLGIC